MTVVLKGLLEKLGRLLYPGGTVGPRADMLEVSEASATTGRRLDTVLAIAVAVAWGTYVLLSLAMVSVERLGGADQGYSSFRLVLDVITIRFLLVAIQLAGCAGIITYLMFASFRLADAVLEPFVARLVSYAGPRGMYLRVHRWHLQQEPDVIPVAFLLCLPVFILGPFVSLLYLWAGHGPGRLGLSCAIGLCLLAIVGAVLGKGYSSILGLWRRVDRQKRGQRTTLLVAARILVESLIGYGTRFVLVSAALVLMLRLLAGIMPDLIFWALEPVARQADSMDVLITLMQRRAEFSDSVARMAQSVPWVVGLVMIVLLLWLIVLPIVVFFSRTWRYVLLTFLGTALGSTFGYILGRAQNPALSALLGVAMGFTLALAIDIVEYVLRSRTTRLQRKTGKKHA